MCAAGHCAAALSCCGRDAGRVQLGTELYPFSDDEQDDDEDDD
jgi:hypothetical protein